jgi:uncharacterized protein (TIGR03083 family)
VLETNTPGSSGTTLQPFDARPFFEHVRASLLQLLADLSPSDWNSPTQAGSWSVRDVTAHLLGDDLSRLSRSRDDHPAPGPSVGQSLAQFLNWSNQQWVNACMHLSPQVLQDLLTHTTKQVMSYWQHVILDATGEPVSWISPQQPAPVWLDCARDFTEDWVHQQQIRRAVGAEDDPDAAILHAVLDTFMHAMPRTLDQHDARVGTSLVVRLRPEVTTTWSWSRNRDHWSAAPAVDHPTTELITDDETWWQLCVRMLTPDQALARTRVLGDRLLAQTALQIVSIIRDP